MWTDDRKKAAEEAAEDVALARLAALERAGITFDALLGKLKRELNARSTKFFQHEGTVKEKRTVIDWATRQSARIDAHRLRGDYPADKQDVTVHGDLATDIRAARERAKKRTGPTDEPA